MILLIDNYDSFTYNLLQYMAEVSSKEIKVCRNDEISIQGITNLNPSHIVISPGPCTPNEAGISMEIVKTYKNSIPILGVCLGHQTIGQALGAKVVQAKKIFHGKTSSISHNSQGIFADIQSPFIATRYHSLAIEKESLPDDFRINAWTDDGEIMALEHQDYPTLIGLQFHPESILTDVGKKLLFNFLNL